MASNTRASRKKGSGKSLHVPCTQRLYMQLRSRKEKGVKREDEKHTKNATKVPQFCSKVCETPQLTIPPDLRAVDKDRCSVCVQNYHYSLQDADSVIQSRSSHGNTSVFDTKPNKVSSTHAIRHSSVSGLHRSDSLRFTRKRRQTLHCSLTTVSEAVVGGKPDLLLPSSRVPPNKMISKVEGCFSETPMVCETVHKDRDRETSTTRTIRRTSRDTILVGSDAESTQSTSRTSSPLKIKPFDIPLSTLSKVTIHSNDIECFLSSAEQRERRRFIDRFNFDPLFERPLSGRYEWFKL
ncbi:hypothetical protein KP509_18G037300 [Ceratopteris richardii]|uniref:Cyclin-dependent kinase inhibitor domain-containing protein n=1 Tax=Ceratopteris richardii TaxID=49495 RepID=A0A8T2SS01_CERRI|nr:hypothetical protein KP509_18G037300 [Ceratopteris richardii]